MISDEEWKRIAGEIGKAIRKVHLLLSNNRRRRHGLKPIRWKQLNKLRIRKIMEETKGDEWE